MNHFVLVGGKTSGGQVKPEVRGFDQGFNFVLEKVPDSLTRSLKTGLAFAAGGTLLGTVYSCGGIDSETNQATDKCYRLERERGFWHPVTSMTSGTDLLHCSLGPKFEELL